jgi:D-glycero-D-manno-heptose 1,7-bisphosphate phosphatase
VSISSLRPAVFLDRDGTLNRPAIRNGLPFPPATVDEFCLFPGVVDACRALHTAGFVLVVVTNQPDVGRGTIPQPAVEAIHKRLQVLVPEIARIEVCYDSGCDESSRRRKPAPGMLLDAATTLGLDLTCSWMIGDRWRDVDCAHRAQIRSIFIDLGHREELRSLPDFTVTDFPSAAEIVLSSLGLPEPICSNF